MSATITVETWSYARPWHLLRNQLADCTRWRKIVSGDDAAPATQAEALDKIIYFWIDKHDTLQTIPLCMIRGLDDDEREQVSILEFSGGGPIVLEFVLPVDPAYVNNYQDAGLDLFNKIGEIFKQLKTLLEAADRSNYLGSMNTITLNRHGEGDATQNNGKQFWLFEFVIIWTGM